MRATPPAIPDGLRAQIGLFGAVSTGLAAILGTGIYAVIAPAAGLAGPALLISLLIASFIAFCNALSSTQLAAVLPRTGGTFEFGRRVLGPRWGFGAGWMFLVANTVGPGAIGLAFAEYLSAAGAPVPVRPMAVAIVGAMTVLNAAGIRRSVRVTEAVVVLSVISLLGYAVLGAPGVHPANLLPFAPEGWAGILRATALLFFAYTGYSRIATLVEEVESPARTIPRATVAALSGATAIYLVVAAVTVGVLGATTLSHAVSPLTAAMLAVGSGAGVGLVTVGALSTTFNEGLSDLLGVSRVAFAMGRAGELPSPLARLGTGENPWRAVVAVGVVSATVAAVAPFAAAIAVSSLGTLLYYSVTNLSVLRLPSTQRRYPAGLAVAGLVGCVGLAASLPPMEIALGLAILAAGFAYRFAWGRVGQSR